jgi:hypothetical protein
VKGWLRRGPIVAVVLAGAVAVLLWSRTDDDEAPPRAAAPAPVAVTSDAPRLADLAALAAASTVVVRGEVVEAEHGRLFGEPGGDATVESRVLTLRVDRVLRGPSPGAARLLVEEEGWDGDGAPLIVDGAAPSKVGDTGIWFLTRVGTGEEQRYVVVSAEGRYLERRRVLVGAKGDDPLIARLVALGPAGLADAVAALP